MWTLSHYFCGCSQCQGTVVYDDLSLTCTEQQSLVLLVGCVWMSHCVKKWHCEQQMLLPFLKHMRQMRLHLLLWINHQHFSHWGSWNERLCSSRVTMWWRMTLIELTLGVLNLLRFNTLSVHLTLVILLYTAADGIIQFPIRHYLGTQLKPLFFSGWLWVKEVTPMVHLIYKLWTFISSYKQ